MPAITLLRKHAPTALLVLALVAPLTLLLAVRGEGATVTTASNAVVGSSPGGEAAGLSGTFLVGDSTGARIAPLLSQRRPEWYVDAVPGRPVRALPWRIEDYLKHNPEPANLIMALGTNGSHAPEWTQERLDRAIAKLPEGTNVFLVLVVRAGASQHRKDLLLQQYNGFSEQLALSRPHTYLVDWRGTVLADPTLNPWTGRSDLLDDGTHQTGAAKGRPGPGVVTYVDLLEAEFDRVNGPRAQR